MGGAVFTPEQRSWRWYDDDGAEPTNPKAGEDTTCTLATPTTKARLRICIDEAGGKAANNITIDLYYSTNDVDFVAFDAGNHWDYGDGAATEGNIVTGLKLGDSDTQGEYSESTGGSGTYDIGANNATEFDICILQTGTATSDQLYYFRVHINGAEVPLQGVHVHANLTTAGGVEHEKALFDTLSITDSIVKDVGMPKSEAALAIADAISKEPQLAKSEAALAIADDVTNKAVGLGKADLVAIADTFTKASAFARAFADTIFIADSFTKASAFIRAIGDTVAIADALAKALGLIKSEAALAIADAIEKEPRIVKADNLALADVLGNKAIGLFPSDTLVLADDLSKTVRMVQVDTVAIADIIAKGFGLPLADTLAIVDLFAYVYIPGAGTILTLNLTDTLAITDNLSSQVNYRRSLADNLILTDTFTRQVVYLRAFADALAIIDGMYIQWPPPARLAIARMVASRLAASRLGASRLGKRRTAP